MVLSVCSIKVLVFFTLGIRLTNEYIPITIKGPCKVTPCTESTPMLIPNASSTKKKKKVDEN
jgi:hypothetical protein